MIELNQICFTYADGADGGLKDIDLTVKSGECILLRGRSGCGKTTITRLINGLIPGFFSGELEGDVTINNESMQDVNYELFAESVRAECSFGIRNPPTKLLDDTIDLLGLMPYQNRHSNTLSGGQKQRVAVAVSMICGKELLIFDEPTSGLDYDSMEQVARLIRSLASNGKIIFVVTHDYEFVCQSCSRLLHFDNGTLEEDLLLSEQNEKKIHTIFGLKEEENYA